MLFNLVFFIVSSDVEGVLDFFCGSKIKNSSEYLLIMYYRFEPDMLAFSGCYYGGGDKERSELGAIRRRWKTLHVQLLELKFFNFFFLSFYLRIESLAFNLISKEVCVVFINYSCAGKQSRQGT